MIKHLENENFNELISKGTTLVDFYAEWCGPCKMMATELEKMTDKNILKVNTDNFPSIATSYGVMSIPTLILIKDGKEVKRTIGYHTAAEIEKIFN